MKSRRKSDEFREFKTKVFWKSVLLIFVGMLALYLLYAMVLDNHFADWMVDMMQRLFGWNYGRAYWTYESIFRSHSDWVLFFGIALCFLIIFRIYLGWFVRYFREINKGVDSLLDDEAGEVTMSNELAPVERKINMVNHTLKTRKLDAQLAEQRKNDLIVYLAHDLKTPLASVVGYLNLLRDEGEISEELRKKYLSISLEKAERLEDLINEFFEIARFNLSNITLQCGQINLTRLFEMLLYEFGPMLAEKKLTCKLDMEPDIMFCCDADKLQRVFDNLLRNAVIYSYEESEIGIVCVRERDRLNIRFSNHGDTIPKDKLEKIFEQFYRLDAARGTSKGGAGLGLAIAKEIVELHGGKILADSENGLTTFSVELPLSQTEGQSAGSQG